jgi:drug/metabolite transporter (DMT)-like permease
MTEAAATPAGLVARCQALPGNVRGALWMLLAGAVFTAQGAIVKGLGSRLDSFEIAFFRCAFGLLAIAPFVIGPYLTQGGTALFLTGRPWMHLARALVGVTGMFCGFYAVTHLPLADATAISFTKPLFMIVLAVIFLGEQVRWRRWSATIVGFLGVLIIMRPGTDSFQPAALVALLGSFFIADVVVLVKKLSATERNVTILFYFAAITTVVSAIPAAFVWQTPTLHELGLLVLVGVTATLGQACALRAYRAGEATAVVPFDYARLIFAVVYGYAFFAELPDLWSYVGAAVLIASTLYIAFREIRIGKPRAAPAGAL